MPGRPLPVLDLGRRGYAEVEALQEAARARVIAGDLGAERLLLVEHDPVVTLGRRHGEGALRVPPEELARRGVALHASSRGGEATYHGPGQLVAYAIVRLDGGVVAHVEALGGAVVAAARRFGVAARFDRARPGVWVGERKLASIGVHVRRRVAMHGVALNLTREALAGFGAIVPCGMPGVAMTCLEDEHGAPVARHVAAEALGRAFAELRLARGAT